MQTDCPADSIDKMLHPKNIATISKDFQKPQKQLFSTHVYFAGTTNAPRRRRRRRLRPHIFTFSTLLFA